MRHCALMVDSFFVDTYLFVVARFDAEFCWSLELTSVIVFSIVSFEANA